MRRAGVVCLRWDWERLDGGGLTKGIDVLNAQKCHPSIINGVALNRCAKLSYYCVWSSEWRGSKQHSRCFTTHSENLCTKVNAHFRPLMAAKWKFLKFGICKTFQWIFVYFWSMNYYYGCMSLLFWKGRLSEMDFMLFTAECLLVESLCCNRPEEWHYTSKLKSYATVTQSFSTSRSLLCTLTYRGPDCLIPSACGFNR